MVSIMSFPKTPEKRMTSGAATSDSAKQTMYDNRVGGASHDCHCHSLIPVDEEDERSLGKREGKSTSHAATRCLA